MAFPTVNSNNNILLMGAGSVVSDFDSFIHTVEEGYSTTKEPKGGYFAKIDANGKLELADGTDSIGVAVNEQTNFGTGVKCDDNPIQSYISHGLVYVVLKAGIAPKRSQFVKVDASGVADIGAITDGAGRFMGIYGQPTTDTTPLKTMQIQLGAM